jgi:hypothetical protein
MFARLRRRITIGGVGIGARIVAPNLGGRDPLPTSKVGCRDGLTPGHFRVRLRYPSPAVARAVLASATLEDENGACVVHLDVPVVHRVHFDDEDLPHEIRWEW